MEEIYLNGLESRREWCTDVVNIKSYFHEFNEVLSSKLGEPSRKKGIKELDILNNIAPKTKELTTDQLAELFESINPAHLTLCSDDLLKLEVEEKPQLSTASKDLQLLKEVCPSGKKTKANRIKMERNKFNRKEIVLDTAERCGTKDLQPRQHTLLFFRVHEPFLHDKGATFYVRPGQCSHEIAVLGHQTLSDLRDKIICELDFQDVHGDCSNSPNVPVKERAREVYTSGMFYFGNTFYIDTRLSTNKDYSITIREWGERRGLEFDGERPMQLTTVQDLELRLGYPYVYIHQGCCEHVIILSDARMLNQMDSCYSRDYPLMNKLSQPRMIYCMLCTRRAARWIVRDCEKLAHDPTYECQHCFKRMHYIKGKKVGQFKAYHFWQRGILM